MPPKKVVGEPERKPLIGRVGTNLRVGIVGVPNVGKSTFFNVLTKSAVAAENFPFCTIDPNENKTENKELYDIKCNPYLLLEKAQLKYIRGYEADKEEAPTSESSVWYPLVNSYYEYSEDYDATNRIPHLLHEIYARDTDSASNRSNSSADDLPIRIPKMQRAPRRDHMIERLAQVRFLNTPPASFLLTGKPGLDIERLGRLLAESWRCVYIDPESLLREDIETRRRSGLCIDFNLRCGRAISVDVLVHLLEKKLSAEEIKHRGFVLCGFPLIKNDLYVEENSSGLGVFSANEIFEEVETKAMSKVSEVSQFEQELVEQPENSTNGIRMEFANEQNQMEHIFKLIEPFNYYLIYVKCPNAEVVNIRQDNRVDAHTLALENQEQERSDELYFDEYDEIPCGEYIHFSHDPQPQLFRKFLKQQRHFPAHVREQLARYLFDSQLTIERQILLMPPDKVIKLDARMPPNKLLRVVIARLHILNLCPIPLPQRMVEPHLKFEEQGEGMEAPTSEWHDLPVEEAFEMLSAHKTLDPSYKWCLSPWKFFGPVALYNAQKAIGRADLAVQFLNNIYFLSSEAYLDAFLKNPRPFLLPPMPCLVRRILVLGPPKQINENIAKFLHYFTGLDLINYQLEKHKYIHREYAELLDEVEKQSRQVVIDMLKERRRQAYLMLEESRLANLRRYQNCIKEYLMKMLPVIEGSIALEDSDLSLERFLGMKDVLHVQSVEEVRKLLSDDQLITSLLPTELQEPTVFDGDAVESDNEDVIAAVSEAIRALQEGCLTMQDDNDDIATFINHLIEEKNGRIRTGEILGWIIDEFPPSVDILQMLHEHNLPDLTVLVEPMVDEVDMEATSMDCTRQERDQLYLEFGVRPFLNEPDINEYGNMYKGFPERKNPVNYKDIVDTLNEQHVDVLRLLVGVEPYTSLLSEILHYFQLLTTPDAKEVPFDENAIEELEDEVSSEEESLDVPIMSNRQRRLGAMADYDPVAYTQYGVLWKCREERMVSFNNSFWCFANEDTMQSFISSPLKFTRQGLENQQMPPPRICIVGNRKIGKTTQARDLALRLGLYYCDFELEFIRQHGEKAFQEYLNDMNYEMAIVDILRPLWWQPNKKMVGFVLDGFPRRTNDVRIMCQNYFIPDCFVELSMDMNELRTRLLDILINEWRYRMEIEKTAELEEYKKQLVQWTKEIESRKQELMEERLNLRKSESLLSVQSYEQDENERKIQDLLPEPKLNDNWESVEMATERLRDAVIEDTIVEPQYLAHLQQNAVDANIPWFSIDANMDQSRVYNLIMLDIMQYVFRSESLFARAYDISIEMAEKLLDRGYCLLSRFGRLCPVQVLENDNMLPMYIHSVDTKQLCPVMYQSYILFLAGAENRDKFKANILKYMQQAFETMPMFRVRLAVIGPPHSGKTTLCTRLSRNYTLQHISVGKAVRYVQRYMPSSLLARKVRDVLNEGKEVPMQLAMKCCEILTFDTKAVAVGYVMDNIPSTIAEMMFLAHHNLIPHLIFDIDVDLSVIYNRMDLFPSAKKPNYGKQFIRQRYEDWQIDHKTFRSWVDTEYQNRAVMQGSASRWALSKRVDQLLLAIVSEIKYFYRNVSKDIPLRVANMLVTPHEFIQRQCEFKEYCPLCLYYFNKLTSSGLPPDRTDLVLYQGRFYCLCSTHICEFIDDPEKFLGKNIIHALPTFFEYSVRKDKEQVAEQKVDVALDMRSMPIMGMLEQYVASQVIAAIIEVDKLRPLIPGLTISQSALIILGICLKINNPNTLPWELAVYQDLKRRCMDGVIQLQDIINEFKNTINPYIHYEERLPKFEYKSNYPSSSPNLVIWSVLDELLNRVGNKVPAFLNVVDIAGLVKGASEGQGLGNAFLSHISACDAVFHLCRAFEDDDVTHVEGDVNPVRDLEIIGEELRLKDEEMLLKKLEGLERTVLRGNDKKLKPEYDTLVKIKGVLVDEKKHLRFHDWTANEIDILNKYLFLTSKPALYLINLSEKDYIKKKNKWLIKIKEWVDKHDPGSIIVPFSGAFEFKLLEMDEGDVKKYLDDNHTTSALDKIIVQGYKTLQLEYFFTAGPDEVKAWTIQKGTKAPQAAGRIHTDFEKGFIMAEVMRFADFKDEGSEAAAKAAGKYRQQGRNYTVEDGDIIFFKFNAGAGLKDAKKK